MTADELLAEARKRHRGAARAYGRAADGSGRDVALIELERAAVVAVIAAAESTGTCPTACLRSVLEAATKGLGSMIIVTADNLTDEQIHQIMATDIT